jgi:AmmeMemoRadiSam system protein B
MDVRESVLPPGWYPGSGKEIDGMISGWKDMSVSLPASPVAGIVPHAGWFFSGELLWNVLKYFPGDLDVIAVAGGHKTAGTPVVGYFEEAYETPEGPILQDSALFGELSGTLDIMPDRHADNTVEVVLPMVKHLFPDVRYIGLRAAPDESAVETGRALYKAAEKLGRKCAVIGSTDLTHYGLNYGFMPPDSLDDPAGWVEKRDRALIGDLLDMKGKKALERAERDHSACSAGGAVTALAYAGCFPGAKGFLVGYDTSLSRHSGGSFVGYTGILFAPEKS